MEKNEKNEKNKTWQENVADEVLAIAVAIKVQGEQKHDVKIGIDAAVQAAGMAYCSKRTHEHRENDDTGDDTGKAQVGVFDAASPYSSTTKPE